MAKKNTPAAIAFQGAPQIDIGIKGKDREKIAQGLSRILFVNNHGGNAAALEQVARELKTEHGVLIARDDGVAAQHALVRERLALRDRDVADSRADVDVALRAEVLQQLLDAGILVERLDERADGVLHHRSHLVLQLRELRRRKSLVEPAVIGLKIELGIANEKVRRAEATKGLEPCVGSLPISLEGIDIR